MRMDNSTCDKARHLRWARLAPIAVCIPLLFTSVAGCALFGSPGGASGEVRFSDSNIAQWGAINTLTLSAHGLPAPEGGRYYVGWLLDNEREAVTSLGKLSPTAGGANGDYGLTFNAPSPDVNLLFSGDQTKLEVDVTQESPATPPPTRPSGKVMLVGIFPHDPFVHVQHLVVGHPPSVPPGHLVRLLRQTHILYEEPVGQLLQAINGVRPKEQVRCAAQSVLNMVEGTGGANYQPLSTDCTYARDPITQNGDGHGTLNHTADALHHLDVSLKIPTATAAMHTSGSALSNELKTIYGWMAKVDQYALEVRNGDTTHVRDIEALCRQAAFGDLTSGNKGVDQAFVDGQAMATLALTAPSGA
jgi:hypothetical protein